MLIYANGNNELEPEINESKIDLEKSCPCEDVNVIMQIGRIPGQLVRILRPKISVSCENGEWSGVRRYRINNTGSVLITDLGNINMADPGVLYNFIKWGFKNYPSRRRMLVIGGHGFSFVSVMTDFSQDVPFMMGVPQMCRVINLAMGDIGKGLDIFVLDACYMNSIEIIYELGKKNKCPVKYMLTYIKDGPLKGMPYHRLISTLNCDCDTTVILKSMVSNMIADCAVIEINYKKLKVIKGIVDRLAYVFLTSGANKHLNPEEIIYSQDKSCPWYAHAMQYKKCLREIITHYKSAFTGQHTIDIAHREFRFNDSKMDYITLIYLNLGFCRNNCWAGLLTCKSANMNIDPRFTALRLPLEPIVMHPRTIEKIIGYMNMPYTQDEINDVMRKLFLYKKWSYGSIINRLYAQLDNILPK